MQETIASLSLFQNIALFVVLAIGVWYAGSRLTFAADTLSDRFNLAKSMVGLLFLALATSLPEVATTLTAAVRGNSGLVLNNLFGGVALQTAILASADLWARRAITTYPRKATHALEATLLVALLAITLIIIQLGEPVAYHRIGAGTVLIGLVYVGVILLLRNYDDANDWIPVDLPEAAKTTSLGIIAIGIDTSTARLSLIAFLACAAILVFGLCITLTAETIAYQSGLGAGFVGATILAGATSLPELSTTITAVRMGAYTLAISNIFGSNLIMIVLLTPADAIYENGAILRDAGPTATLSLSFSILITSVFLIGLIMRRKRQIGRLGVDSLIVIVLFAASLVAYYSVM